MSYCRRSADSAARWLLWPHGHGISPFLFVERSHAGAEPNRGRGCEQGVGLADGGHGDLSLDELVGVIGVNVSVQHGGRVFEEPLGCGVTLWSGHRGVSCSRSLAS